jgi:uroporphyrinogen decarboxylase
MTNRERVLAAFAHEQPDRTPYEVGFTQKAWAALVEHTGGEDFAKQLDNSFHTVRAAAGPKDCWLDENTWQDEFGVRWDRSIDRDIGNVCNQVLAEPDLDTCEFPDPRETAKFGSCAEECAYGHAAGRMVQFAIGFSLFERAWTLRGMEALMIDMLERPDFVHALLDAICDYNVALVERALEHDIDSVHFGDDWGSQRGLLMSPAMWRTFLKPRLARQYGVAKAGGKFVTIHSCGRVQEVFTDLLEIGLDCFNPFQPEVMDPYEMKTAFGDRLSFWGGVSTQRLLPYGTENDVVTEVRRLKREVGRSGGFIIAPAHAIPGDARPANILRMIEVMNEG